MKQKIKYNNILSGFSSPRLFFFLSLYLFVLVFFATIMQKYIGLHQVQEEYFSVFFIKSFIVPFPGGYFILLMIFINLFLKITFKTNFKISNFGVSLCHIGVLLLLFSGFINVILLREGNISLKVQNHKNYFYSKNSIQMSVFDKKNKFLFSIPEDELKKIKKIKNDKISFSIEILQFSKNTLFLKKKLKDSYFSGFGGLFLLRKKKLEKKPEKNIAGIIFRITLRDDFKSKKYSIIQGMKEDCVDYKFLIERSKTYIPFYVELIKFKKELHHLTNKAKKYNSFIFIIENNKKQSFLIKMNNPLRYSGYIFYQSSYIEDIDGVSSILAVVQNNNYFMPYISSMLMSLGLIVYIFTLLQNKLNKK